MFHLNTTGLNFKDEKFCFHSEGCSHPFHKDILIHKDGVIYSKGCPHPFQKNGLIQFRRVVSSHPIQKDVLNPFQRDGWSHPFKSIHFHNIIKDSTFVAKKLLLECWCF
jgi:hypothetical protein